MRVKFLTSIAYMPPRGSYEAGDEGDLETKEAQRLIGAGLAEPVGVGKKLETATRKAPRKAVKR